MNFVKHTLCMYLHPTPHACNEQEEQDRYTKYDI
jgi:hypothetical protein